MYSRTLEKVADNSWEFFHTLRAGNVLAYQLGNVCIRVVHFLWVFYVLYFLKFWYGLITSQPIIVYSTYYNFLIHNININVTSVYG